MEPREALIKEVEAFTARSGMAETTLGSRALKDSRFIGRLRHNKAVSLRSIETLRRFMQEWQP